MCLNANMNKWDRKTLGWFIKWDRETLGWFSNGTEKPLVGLSNGTEKPLVGFQMGHRNLKLVYQIGQRKSWIFMKWDRETIGWFIISKEHLDKVSVTCVQMLCFLKKIICLKQSRNTILPLTF